MATPTTARDPAPGTPAPAPSPFAIPARLHVVVLFLTQFIVMMAIGGGFAPWYYRQGLNLVLVIAGAVAAYAVVQFLLGALGKLVPVRCTGCRQRSRFQGFGWWPFIYKYRCRGCDTEMRLEVQGG